MRTEIIEHKHWPVGGHKCDIILYWREGEKRPYQAHLEHYDETGTLVYDELFSSKTAAKRRLSELWGEYQCREK